MYATTRQIRRHYCKINQLNMSSIKDIIRNCIRKEAEALMHIADTIDDTDMLFLEKIKSCNGNIIISGIGKSFMVGNKIAGTLSSIGTTTIAISITDLLHGNIGMLHSNDLLIIISNSGETKEIIELVNHLRTIENYTIISITGNKNSTLAKLSQISKEIQVDEAGPFSIVPTSSTTAVMAYGDALATALAKIQDLTLNTFRTFHPGGKIGALL